MVEDPCKTSSESGTELELEGGGEAVDREEFITNGEAASVPSGAIIQYSGSLQVLIPVTCMVWRPAGSETFTRLVA